MTGGHLPECFEMEERTLPGVGDVLQLVSGRQLLGFVRERSDGQLAGGEQLGCVVHGNRPRSPGGPWCKQLSVSALELTAVLQCLGGNHMFRYCGPMQVVLYSSLCRPDMAICSRSVMASLTGHLESSSLHACKPLSTRPKLLLTRAYTAAAWLSSVTLTPIGIQNRWMVKHSHRCAIALTCRPFDRQQTAGNLLQAGPDIQCSTDLLVSLSAVLDSRPACTSCRC